mgnify:CR=1 FL=1
MIYVWSELYFPPINCTMAIPLSYYYYPIALTLFDMGKLNVYLAMRYASRKEFMKALVVTCNMEVLLVNTAVTIVLGVIFLPSILYTAYVNNESSVSTGYTPVAEETVWLEDPLLQSDGDVDNDTSLNRSHSDTIYGYGGQLEEDSGIVIVHTSKKPHHQIGEV